MKETPLFRGRIFSVAREEHALPDGRRSDYEIVRHPGGAAVLPLLSDDRIVLLHQFRPAIGESLWEIPAGRLDEGEAPEACAIRELEEEAGYRAECLEKIAEIYPAVGYCDELIHLFVARNLTQVPYAREHDEYIETVSLPLSEAIAMVQRGEIRDAKTQLALLMVEKQNPGAGSQEPGAGIKPGPLPGGGE